MNGPAPASAVVGRGRRARRVRPRWTVSATVELWLGIAVFVIDLLCQLALIGLGLYITLSDVTVSDGTVSDDAEAQATIVAYLLTWCLFGSLYWVGAVTAGWVSSRRRPRARGTQPPSRPLQRFRDRLEMSPVAGAIMSLATFLASFVGLTAAVELLVLRNDPDWSVFIEIVAVWTMLLAWALFHWGWARLYSRAYHRAATPKPLDFPGDDEPGLADFVYFSFTTATAFSTSDVTVTTRRMRWTVIWHSTLSFFFNALIIVLAVNTLIQN